jgi:hypothetical protein
VTAVALVVLVTFALGAALATGSPAGGADEEHAAAANSPRNGKPRVHVRAARFVTRSLAPDTTPWARRARIARR